MTRNFRFGFSTHLQVCTAHLVLEDSTPVSSSPGPRRARSARPENANTGMTALSVDFSDTSPSSAAVLPDLSATTVSAYPAGPGRAAERPFADAV